LGIELLNKRQEGSVSFGQFLSLLEGLLQVAHHVEPGLGELVTLTFQQSTETFNGLLELHDLALLPREHLTHVEWLREEFLDLPGSGDDHLVFFGELVHTQDGNDILQRLVILKQLLNLSCSIIVLVSHDGGVEHSGGGVEGVHGGIDSQLSEGSAEHSGGVQMGEGGGGGRVGEIIGGDIDGLDGSDGTLFSGGDPFLQGSQVGSEGGLVTDGRGDTSQQGRHLGAGLREPEDVVNKQQHILVFFISEVLSHG